MRRLFQNTIFLTLLALLLGLGLGLAYSWLLSPVTYVDANPALLRADFKDQYRIVIAASYAANQDLARARSRLNLLGDVDPVGELSAQAQRMLGAGEPFEKVRPLAQLATDLTQGYASNLPTATFFPTFSTPNVSFTSTATQEPENINEEVTVTSQPTLLFEQTPLTPIIQESRTPRPTFTPTPGPGAPFLLVGQEPVCAPAQPGLMQFIIMNSRHEQIAGIEITVTWDQGEDHFFTGLKPELGNGYADFVMEANTTYNIRIITGGAFVADISASPCTDPNGASYTGGLLLTFQQQ